MRIEETTASDWHWIESNSDPLGGPRVVSHGTLHTLREHNGLVAWEDNTRVGFAVYREIDDKEVELLAILATVQWRGIGSTLMTFVEELLREQGVKNLWLCTTNDNLSALQFYQTRGYRLKALRTNAFREVQRLKDLPEENVIGQHGIVIRDELTLAKDL